MQTRSHTLKIDLPVEPEAAFKLLITPSAIRQWWGASGAIVLAEQGGTWAGWWGADEDNPEYITIATIEVFDPPRRLVLYDYRYRSRQEALPFDADFRTEFTVEKSAAGSTLQVTQDGFPCGPEADDFYLACEKGWHDTFQSVLAFVTGNHLDK